MATPSDLGRTADRLFRSFMAPLVLGGSLRPGRPIGARAALALGHERRASDAELSSRVQLARVRRARQLFPLDRLEEASEVEWALAAALHDAIQATHPGFDSALRRRQPGRLLGVAMSIVERIPPPRNAREALSRHTWFARMFEVRRTDTSVSWWVGSRMFFGEPPPPRLLLWPELRRVRAERTRVDLADLPAHGSPLEPSLFAAALAQFVTRTPLTDLATCHRQAPTFVWTRETLGFVSSPLGKMLALRALAQGPEAAVDAALGRATRALLEARDTRALGRALEILADRALSLVISRDSGMPETTNFAKDSDAGFARSAGARFARLRPLPPGIGVSREESARILRALEALSRNPDLEDLEPELTRVRNTLSTQNQND